VIQAEDEIFNPRTGQRMTFLETPAETGGEILRIDSVNPPSDALEPEHVHPKQTSGARVLSGTLRFWVAGSKRSVGPGEEIWIPPNTPHRFWNDGDVEARSIQEFRPALDIEGFFRRLFALAQHGRVGRNGLPGPLDAALLIADFGDEIRLTSPPWPAQRAFAVLVAPIARLARKTG
jgi:quercetin dioxygenase-like cupin family protein